jgi:hypothetical protein
MYKFKSKIWYFLFYQRPHLNQMSYLIVNCLDEIGIPMNHLKFIKKSQAIFQKNLSIFVG